MSITLQQLKTALKIDYTTDDAELTRLIAAASAFIQEYTGVSLDTAKKTQYVSYWMKTRLTDYPFVSIDSVKYYNSSNTLTTMPSTDYFIIRSESPSVYINFSELPDVYENTEIQINYTCGYTNTPDHIVQLLVGIVGAWYNNPEATAAISLSTVPLSAQVILDMIRTKGVLE